ncbi:peroxiredoxin-like 2C [Protopterus annectens]|uniref:peroxiredoxin-like 2C n=1 Tax=Protopterus annectens TaxID=7888 RepID=UPI001CFB3282|nr:peroxiredoxin-like 2C [Protopterus annectens]
MASQTPVTQQICRKPEDYQVHIPEPAFELYLKNIEDCCLVDREGQTFPFRNLHQDQKVIIIFVRHFLCYTCKEYVEDLAKIPRSSLKDADVRLVVIGQCSYHHIEAFCLVTGYHHEIYVDPDREIYKALGMKQGETTSTPAKSPHVKSGILTGSFKSFCRAMKSPVFDFQGEPSQQGGAMIVGPGKVVHFLHLDRNRLDHVPINVLLQTAGVQTIDFQNRPRVIEV